MEIWRLNRGRTRGRDGEDGGDRRKVGYMGRAPPWWSRTPPRDPRLGRCGCGAPNPKSLSVYFHPRGNFFIITLFSLHFFVFFYFLLHIFVSLYCVPFSSKNVCFLSFLKNVFGFSCF